MTTYLDPDAVRKTARQLGELDGLSFYKASNRMRKGEVLVAFTLSLRNKCRHALLVEDFQRELSLRSKKAMGKIDKCLLYALNSSDLGRCNINHRPLPSVTKQGSIKPDFRYLD